MLYLRSEGGIVRNGFNFYPLSDKGSVGFIFRLGNTAIWFRYSKITGKFICQKRSTT
jgi:hypothetical protein